jgi:GNAT superfamily N-acetyltransferase
VSFEVRAATAADISGIAAVAAAAWRDTYAGLLRADTIEAFIANAYSGARLERRIEADTFLVAVVDGRIVAFADGREAEDRVDLFAIYALPEWRGQGSGSALLDELRRLAPGKAVAAEVLTGNRKGEVFYEHRGFAPRETVETELFGERVIERRWWREADD